MIKFLKNVNLLTSLVLCVYPVLLIVLAILFLMNNSFQTSYLVLAIVTYYGANISVGLGLHRLWSHGAYKTKPWVECVLAVVSAGTLQGPILAWASDHFKHHTYTDEEQDPHSPAKYNGGVKGFLWSHVGWMITGEPTYKNIDRITLKKLGKNKVVMWQYNNYWLLALVMNAVLPALIGFAIYGTIKGCIAAFLFMGLGRALQQQFTFCVNSACHFFGKRTYYAGTARDIWWLFMFLLGENWHNFHHAFARDYRNGVKWYQLDVHKWLIALMEKTGLAWGLVRTQPERIAAKVNETERSLIETYREKLEGAFARASEISALAHKYVEQYESATISAIKVKKCAAAAKLQELQEVAEQLMQKLKEIIDSCDINCEKTIKIINKKLNSLERSAIKLGVKYEAESV